MSTTNSDELCLTGISLAIKYRDEKTGYAGFYILADKDNQTEKVFCCGKIQNLMYNTPLKLYGKYETDGKNRVRFVFKEYLLFDAGKSNEINFILSLNLKGINISHATEFTEYFSGGLFAAVKDIQTASVFKERCPNTIKKYAEDVYKKAKRALIEQDVFTEVIRAGGTYANVTKLIKKYKEHALMQLRRNPYKIGYNAGFAYNVCENVAFKYNINRYDKNRAIGLLYYAMDNISNNGDCYATIKELKNETARLQSNSPIESTPFEFILACAILDDNFVIENNRVYKKSIKESQVLLAKNIVRLERAAKMLDFNINEIDKYEKAFNIKLSASQKRATSALNREGVKIITGGPGTGKSTLINMIIKYFEDKYPKEKIILCAPTGCAAQNMAEKTGHIAETIHRTLGLQPYQSAQETKLKATKKMEERLYIIDEASMLDMELAAALFSAIPNHAIVILIGDIDQLPSVQAGNVLSDLMDAGIDTYLLDETFRQAADSSIITNAYKVNNGDTDLRIDKGDFDIWYCDTEKAAVELCMAFTENDSNDTQVLCPTKKYEVGSINLSNAVQSRKKELGQIYSPHKRYGTTTYYIQDRVIMTQNNYETGYFNGETGVIVDMDEGGIEVMFSDEKTLYIENANLEDMTLAYAITIHKSQGNEYDNVVILLTKKATMMINRNLLYTAITRAKKHVSIITQDRLLEQAINTLPKKRNSALTEEIKHCKTNI